MKDKLKDILSQPASEMDEELLMNYLQGRLTPGEQHEVEEGALSNEFEADALDGLQEIKDKKSLQSVIDELNNDLKKRTDKKKKRRQQMELKLQPWLIIAVIAIIIIAIISYIIIHRAAHSR